MSLEALEYLTVSVTRCGSRVTCDPAPTDTDRDWLVLLKADSWVDFYLAMADGGWEQGGSVIEDEVNKLPPEYRFVSFTLGVDNLIVTDNAEFHRRFIAATSVAKRLNLLKKSDRIALFQAVLYGNVCSQGD